MLTPHELFEKTTLKRAGRQLTLPVQFLSKDFGLREGGRPLEDLVSR